MRIISVAITSNLEVLPHRHSQFMHFIFHGTATTVPNRKRFSTTIVTEMK